MRETGRLVISLLQRARGTEMRAVADELRSLPSRTPERAPGDSRESGWYRGLRRSSSQSRNIEDGAHADEESVR